MANQIEHAEARFQRLARLDTALLMACVVVFTVSNLLPPSCPWSVPLMGLSLGACCACLVAGLALIGGRLPTSTRGRGEGGPAGASGPHRVGRAPERPAIRVAGTAPSIVGTTRLPAHPAFDGWAVCIRADEHVGVYWAEVWHDGLYQEDWPGFCTSAHAAQAMGEEWACRLAAMAELRAAGQGDAADLVYSLP